jgi:hypothetical protein
MRIKAKDWNEAMRVLGTRYPISVEVEKGTSPAHAWSVETAWDGDRKKWTAKIKAGSVNCKIATIAMPFSRASEKVRQHILATNRGKLFQPKTVVHVPLDFDPVIDLAWREIGGDAAPTGTTGNANNGIQNSYEPVPAYFKKKGVAQGGATNVDPNLQRRLYACDLVLSMPRPYLVNEITAFPGGPLGGSIISVDAKPNTPPDISEPPKVYATTKFVVPPIQNTFSDIFFQRFLDEPKDDLHLSTVYALSQPVAAGIGGGGVDETCTLETRYYCHYNLAHATQRVEPRAVTPPLQLVTGLAGGLGDVIFNFILSSQNDFAQSVLDLFNQRSLRGMFWVV